MIPSLSGALRSALEGAQGLGPWGPMLFVAVYVLATLLLVPGSLLTLGAGALYGPVQGSVVVSIASTLGATAAFWAGRTWARRRVARWMEGSARLRTLDAAVKSGGWWIVLLLRLSPVIPFNLLNYAAGMTEVRLRDYVVASWLGMLPATVLYVSIGSAAASLSQLGRSPRARTPLEWTLYGSGLIATLAVVVYLERAARRAIGRQFDSGKNES